ncbi:hypothetical protein DFQ27_002708 [Actinomortierella ambigua]|uniref:Amino acid transporter transmembrane domain-containing protein n=1 Tax=Actinomortierella ambigua TaxID=1343610 RepID=A0A9P6Q7Y8_9FUNG|nr:hypothetical protein DFQ26_002010 [Actinomortierella ambigua]KAG0261936.1 hypothetical protein DFQ27_002708 [Actinomortierella ambigua]
MSRETSSDHSTIVPGLGSRSASPGFSSTSVPKEGTARAAAPSPAYDPHPPSRRSGGGASRSHIGHQHHRHSDDESPLLNHGPHHNPDLGHGSEVGPSAGFWSCTINLANTILGTGMLAMPGALATVGILMGSFMIVFSAMASGLGLYFLTRSASRTIGRSASFFACSKLTYPSAAVWFDLAIAIKCFGVGISYLIIIGDLMPEVVRSLSMIAVTSYGGDGSGEMDPTLWFLLDRRFWITVFMAVIAPLAFLKRLDSLKATSALALGAVVYLVFIVVFFYSFPTAPLPPMDKLRLVRLTPDFFTTLPIFVFAFTCHQNIFSVYNELSDNGQSMLNRIITTSIGSAAVIYHIVAILGYMTFGNSVGSNIILMYNAGMLVTIGRIAIVILVMFSFPLQAHPCRACLDKVLYAIGAFWKSTTLGQRLHGNGAYNSLMSDSDTIAPSSSTDDMASQQTIDEPLAQLDAHGDPIAPPPSELKYVIMTVAIVLFSYLIAISVTELELVLSFVGSTGSTAISFILPGLFYYKLHENERWTGRKIAAVALSVYGALVMVICLSANIRRVVTHH